ncbi:hypothetical protein [Micromonospora endophytica]|uniref:Uncharacterized protein n=1 Tax=Micromonospora endophytica TaxID=515350 RepID=A0A2W2CYI1_9ACTN|nr:hypothetical protein [Micromonospora endophytica]PZF92967.1 hypothetical protein C1I93_18710 [Micromonospora endophytica]RIW47339.1 hypothetical protein D3H59_09980 [Micromonospora endophytica]BCJ60815.1 hypothetical protein Jiend_42370 [Micromonospora endophytica]
MPVDKSRDRLPELTSAELTALADQATPPRSLTSPLTSPLGITYPNPPALPPDPIRPTDREPASAPTVPKSAPTGPAAARGKGSGFPRPQRTGAIRRHAFRRG